MKRKRQRSESFQGGDDDARKRLAAFHARMFELPQEEATVAVPETPRVLFKAKHKKQKMKSADEDDGEPVPMVKFNQNKVKKEKKQKKKVAEKKVTAGARVVTVPGMSSVGVQKKKTVAIVVQDVKEKKVKVHKQKQQTTVQTVKKTTKVHSPQWHSTKKNEDQEEDDGGDPLEQALGKLKEIATQQVAKPPHKKLKSGAGKAVAVPKTEATKESVAAVEKKSDEPATKNNDGSDSHALSDNQRKKLKKKRKQRRQNATGDSNHASGSSPANMKGVKNGSPAITAKSAGTDLIKNTVNGSASDKRVAPSPKSRKKRKKSPKANSLSCVSLKTHAPAQPRQGKPLIVSDDSERQPACKSDHAPGIASKKAKTALVKIGKTIGKAAVVVEEEMSLASTERLTPIAASLAEDATKKTDMFLPAREAPHQHQVPFKQVQKAVVAPKPTQKAVVAPVIQLSDESSSDSDGGGDFDIDHNGITSMYSRIIDSAARERWELVEVGRLVRLFAAEWDFKESKTARFLCETCPELVSVDFLEGLGINLSAKQLVQIFEAGSGNSGVLMNKMASAVENGHLSVRDPTFVSALERRVALMESNGEVMELMHPLLESLSTVRDVGCLLKQLCEHWQLERKIALVQQVLLSNVFDDLDGNQDEILVDLPDLTGRLDFPSRLDQEDVDENGNLKGFLANEDSEFSGEEGSEEEIDEDDSEVDEDPFEGESDSEEEAEISGRPRGRNQFIEDEVDVGEEDEEEEGEEERQDDNESSSDSD